MVQYIVHHLQLCLKTLFMVWLVLKLQSECSTTSTVQPIDVRASQYSYMKLATLTTANVGVPQCKGSVCI